MNGLYDSKPGFDHQRGHPKRKEGHWHSAPFTLRQSITQLTTFTTLRPWLVMHFWNICYILHTASDFAFSPSHCEWFGRSKKKILGRISSADFVPSSVLVRFWIQMGILFAYITSLPVLNMLLSSNAALNAETCLQPPKLAHVISVSSFFANLSFDINQTASLYVPS